jgi:hypothetical protein
VCLTCGCDSPEDSHGDPRHVTALDVATSAAVDGIDLKEARKRIKDGLKAYRRTHADPDAADAPDAVTGNSVGAAKVVVRTRKRPS